MSQFFELHNIIFDMSLNIGINTTLTDLEPFSSGRIMKIIDPSGYGIVLPYLTNDISFDIFFIGSFTYKLNYDLYSAYTLQGFCDFNPYYIDNVGKEVDSNNNVYIYNPTRIDFSNNKISFCINSLNGDVVEKFVINSDGKVGIGKGDIINDYEPTYKLDVNGSIDCQEFYLNGTLLNPAETHNLTSVTITNSNIAYNINVSKIETNNLTINNCLTIMQTLDISNYLDINGTLIGNAIYKYTDVSNETYKDSSDKMYIHDVDVSSVGLPKMTDETSVDVSSIYYNTSDYSIKNSTNTILNSSSSDVTTTPNLFNNSAPTGYLDDYGVKSITYDSNWWGFELQTTDNSMTCMGNMINSITDSGVNSTGSISVTVSENGSDVFDFYTESQVRTGFNIKKSGYYYATVVFPLNGSAYSDINFTFGFLKNTYSGTPTQNYLQTYKDFYDLSYVSPLDDNDSLNKFGSIKDTNYQIEGFSSDSPGITPLPGVITGRTVTQAVSDASMNYSYEYSFPFVITTDGPHFVSFFATSDNNDYSIHNGLRIRFIRYGDIDESDFVTTTYGSNAVNNQIQTNHTGSTFPTSTTITWLSDYATNGVPNGVAAGTQLATLSADTGDATYFTIVSYNGYNDNGTVVDLSYSPFYTNSNQLFASGFSFPLQYSIYVMTDISFQISASNLNGSQLTPTSVDISINYIPSKTIISWIDPSFTDGFISTKTSKNTTVATLTSDIRDETGFILTTTTRGAELFEIEDSCLNLIDDLILSDIGTLDFSINAINYLGTQVTATDFTFDISGILPAETIISWIDPSFTNGLISTKTSKNTTVATLTSNAGDETGFTLTTTTRGAELFEIEDSCLNLIDDLILSDIGTLDFSINAINYLGTQATATDFTFDISGILPTETIISWIDPSFTNGLIFVETSANTTVATLTSDAGDETGFTLTTTTRGAELFEIEDSCLNLIDDLSVNDIGTLDFSINAINYLGTQVTATDFSMTVIDHVTSNTATVSLLLSNNYTVTGTYSENEYTDDSGNTYIAVKFTDDGTITFDQDTSVDYLVVGGGGSGGSGNSSGSSEWAGGGGGGAQVTDVSNQTLVSNTSYTITVGEGGTVDNSTHGHGETGESSTFNLTTAIGGGGGNYVGNQNYSNQLTENTGWSGGGGAAYGARNDYWSEGASGNGGGAGGDGSYSSGLLYGFGGGGGGAGGDGVTGPNAGQGGIGITNNYWDSTDIYYGGGGGAPKYHYNGTTDHGYDGGDGGGGSGDGDNDKDGESNTGGGGGGGKNMSGHYPGAGGSGVVIVRFLKYPGYEETTSTEVINSYTHTTDSVDYNSVKFVQSGLIQFDQVTLVDYLLIGGESTATQDLSNDYWSGTDENYYGLTITESSTVLDADISYEISISSTGATFNDISAAGTTDVSSAVILRYTSDAPTDVNTSTETGTYETNIYTPDGVLYYKVVKFTDDGTITFDQDVSADYLIFGGESTDSTSIVTDYWNGSDETYYGLNSYSASYNFTENTSYSIVIDTAGSTFNSYTSSSDGTSDSGVVIVRYQIFPVG